MNSLLCALYPCAGVPPLRAERLRKQRAQCLQPSLLSGTCEHVSSLILFTSGENNYINNNYIIMNPSCITFMFCCCCLISKSCITLYHRMLYSPTGSSVLGISRAITLEWIVISFSNGSCDPRDWTQVSCLAGGSLTTEQPGKKAFILCLTKLQNVLLIFFMKDGLMKSNVYLCYEVTGGLHSTLSPKCLVDFLPNGHFFSDTSSISFKLVSSLAFLPCYNSHILILVISQSWITSRSWA